MKRLLITGAAGRLGRALRPELAGVADTLLLSDLIDLGPAQKHEEIMLCDLANLDAVMALLEKVDGVLHLGGIPREDTFDRILDANIRGTYNIFEAARRRGCGRIVFASSHHVVGFYEQGEQLDRSAVPRPDTLYGVSKVYGEALARFYFDKFGIESLSIRIGSCVPTLRNSRMISTWLSPADLVALIKRAFNADVVGCEIVYGVSNNSQGWWNNDHAKALGWYPKDSADDRLDDLIDASEKDPESGPAARLQGGVFTEWGHFEDPPKES